MTEIYLVVSGQYSDFGPEAAFSNRSLAQAYVDKRDEVEGLNNRDIDIYTLDTPPENWVSTTVWMSKTGEVTQTPHADMFGRCEGFDFWGRLEHNDPLDTLVWNVRTDNKEHAIKVVNEKRVQIIAADLWGKPIPRRQKEFS